MHVCVWNTEYFVSVCFCAPFILYFSVCGGILNICLCINIINYLILFVCIPCWYIVNVLVCVCNNYFVCVLILLYKKYKGDCIFACKYIRYYVFSTCSNKLFYMCPSGLMCWFKSIKYFKCLYTHTYIYVHVYLKVCVCAIICKVIEEETYLYKSWKWQWKPNVVFCKNNIFKVSNKQNFSNILLQFKSQYDFQLK